METATLIEAFSKGRIVDLSQTLEEHMPHYPTHSKFFHNLWSSYWHGGRSVTYQLVMNEHNGTHVDAPAHFVSEAKPAAHVTIDRVPPGGLIGRGVRLDCREFREGQLVPKDFLTGWEAGHSAIGPRDIVLFNFGWSAYWALGPGDRRYVDDWPGISMAAARYMVEKSVAAIGVDTLSPDPPAGLAKNPIHPWVLENQVLLIENLTSLEHLPDFCLFLALPLKIRDGSGSPIRAVAVL